MISYVDHLTEAEGFLQGKLVRGVLTLSCETGFFG